MKSGEEKFAGRAREQNFIGARSRAALGVALAMTPTNDSL